MSSKTLSLSALAGALALATMGTAGAQDEPAGGEPAAEAAGGLSVEQMFQEAEGYLREIRDGQARVQRMSDRARARGDEVQRAAIDEVQIQIGGLVTVAEEAMAAMRAAAQRGDQTGVAGELARLAVTRQQVAEQVQRAEAAGGADLAATEETEVEIEADPALPGDAGDLPASEPAPFSWAPAEGPPAPPASPTM